MSSCTQSQLTEIRKEINETEGQFLLRKKVYDNVVAAS